jgi:predicted RNA-binding protein YlqC (UPF0109 family)
MKTEDDPIELCHILTLLVRAMVSDPSAVYLSSRRSPGGSTKIEIKIANRHDLGKLIGKQGRIARSLRIIAQAIGKEKGQDYQIDIEGATTDLASNSQARSSSS